MSYGWLIIQRRDDARPVFTVRRSAGRLSTREEVNWLLNWETALVEPGFIEKLAEAHPVARPSFELHTVHRMKGGDLLPEEFKLKTEYPFSVECQVQPWVGFLLPQCDGKSSVRESSNSASGTISSMWRRLCRSLSSCWRFLSQGASLRWGRLDCRRAPQAGRDGVGMQVRTFCTTRLKF